MKYFEGFYVKCLGKEDSIAVIFGRHICGKEKSSFIQIITKDKTYSTSFENEVENFFNEKKFMVKVDKSYADKSGLFLDIDTQGLKAKGFIAFGDFDKIKYGAMGPLKFLPKMECKHFVISMSHSLSGQMTLDGMVFNFDDGVGYIEGDKGRSFPKQYFWSQCNDANSGVSLFASAARIPYLGIRFMGAICVAHYKNKEYRFATYLGAKVKQIDEKNLYVKQGKKLLEIEVLDDKGGLKLFAPQYGQMTRVIEESLERTIRYKLTIGKDILFDFINARAAYEYSKI